MKGIFTAVRSMLVSAALVSTMAATAQMSITPAPGEVTELSDFYLNFDGDWSLANRSAKLTISGPEGVDLPVLRYGSNGTSYYINFDDEAVITAPGEYTLTIPEGKFEINGVPNDETAYHYTVIQQAPCPISIDPAAGNVKKLSTFKLTFDGEWSLGTNRRGKIALTGPEGVTIPSILNGSMGDYYEIYFDDDAEITEPGDYTLTIPAGKFAVNDVDIDEVSFNYTIVDNAGGEPEYVIDPVPGTYESINDGFILTFDTESDVTVNRNMVFLEGPQGDIDIYVESPQGMPYITVIPVDAQNDPIALTEEGRYRLIFGYNSVKIDGNPNEEPYVFLYEIKATEQPWIGEVTAQPADESTVLSLHNISITFVDASVVTTDDNAATESMPTLYDAETLDIVCRGIVFDNGNVLEITLNNDVDTDGSYVLVIPAALVEVDGVHPAYDIMLVYYVNNTDSITAITNDSKTTGVYNINGAKILNDATKDQIGNLPAGIYLINGKKAIIK